MADDDGRLVEGAHDRFEVAGEIGEARGAERLGRARAGHRVVIAQRRRRHLGTLGFEERTIPVERPARAETRHGS